MNWIELKPIFTGNGWFSYTNICGTIFSSVSNGLDENINMEDAILHSLLKQITRLIKSGFGIFISWILWIILYIYFSQALGKKGV